MKRIRFLLLTLVALLAGINASATKTVYIQPNGWTADNAVISLWIWTDGSDGSWATVTKGAAGMYTATFDDAINRMIVTRGKVGNTWTEDENNMWNKTADINLSTATSDYFYLESVANGINVGSGITNAYKVDFNTAISTSNHDFKVASDWKHIVGVYHDVYADGYMSYSYKETDGIAGSGALLANKQYAQNVYNDGAVCYDLLVTPEVSGNIKLWVKASSSAGNSNNAFVELYEVNDAVSEKGSLLKTFKEEIPGYNTGSGTDWVELSYDVTGVKRIGIRAQYVYIDNFSAATANIVAESSLSVDKVMNAGGQTGTTGTNPVAEQLANGKYLIPVKVQLTNNGDVDFVAGVTENYTLTVGYFNLSSGTPTYFEDAKIAIPENLTAGETKIFDVEFTVTSAPDYQYWFVRENVKGTKTSSPRYFGATIAYASKLVLREGGSSSTSDLTTSQSYGRVSTATTRSYEIYNDGTAPLTIKSITLPDGFTSDNLPEIPVGGLVLAKKTATPAFNITLPVDITGAKAGTLIIEYVDAAEQDQVKNLAFSGNALAPGTWFADFDNATSTPVYPTGSIAEGGINSDYSYSAGTYDIYLKGRTQNSYASDNNKFITPKLHATAGQQLTFDVKGTYGSSYDAKVYVSTDRKTWGDPVAYFTYGEKDGAVAIGSSDWVNKSITFDAEGDYYVAFSLYGEFKIDNIIGLTKVDVAHDLYIKEVTWPDASVNSGVALSSKPKVVIIPLTNETAESYTVKYVCGSTILAEGTPVALTASASSTTEFAFNWTPSVESTTTFENSKVVFDFGGGVKYETEPFNLTVLKEPKFHFTSSLPSSKWNEPSDYTTPLAFGKTNTADQKSFYIYNWGTAPLNVKSIVMPTGFSASVDAPFVVAAFDESDMSVASKAIDIVFSAASEGNYGGNMVITYVDGNGNDQTFELAMSGTKLDPSKFYANFGTESNQWPAGSVYQSNVSTSNGGTYSAPNYYITSSSSTNNIFVTPKLTTAVGDKIAFDAKLYNNSTWLAGAVKVYMATTRDEVLNTEDGTTRVLLATFSGESAEDATKITTDYKTFEVIIPAAGDYYLGFEISNRPYVDEIYGLTKAAVAHDWKIASSNIPTEPMQNVTQTATVNILNFGLADEAADSYTVTAYVDGKAAGTGSAVAIPMNHKLSDAGTQLSVNFLSPKAGTFPVYLEVKAGDYSVTTEPVDVTFADEVAKSDVAMETGSASNTNLLHMNWNNSETVNLYSKTVLENLGLTEGAKIKSISFKGYNNGSKNYSTALNVWYEFTDDNTQTQPGAGKYDTSSMTNALSVAERSWASAEGNSGNMVELITINFAEPIVYNGKSLRIVVSSEGTQYQSETYFVPSTLSGTNASYYNRNDTYSTYVNSQSWTANSYLPAIYIGLESSTATLSGAVKTSAREAIEGATVTLKAANGVEYSGTTNASGEYSFNVIQAGLDFTATIEKDGYLKKQFDYSLGGVSKTLDVTLYQQMGIVGTFPGFSWEVDKVMTQDPENPNIFTLEIPDVALEATEYKYKLRADGIWKASSNDGYELPSSGDYSWTVHTAGTYTLKFTANVAEHTLDFELPFTLAEDATGIVDLNWVTITIERDFKAGWNAAILPFDLTAGEITTAFGETAEVAKFLGDEDNGAGSVTVKYANKTDGISAGVPFLIHLDAPVSNLVFTKNVSATIHPVAGTSFDFTGVYTMTDVNAGDYFIKDGEFKKATTNNKVRPFRAYLKAKVAGVRDINFEIVDGDEVTRIEDVNVVRDFFGEDVYNMNGQKVDNLRKGLYIINGKKVVIK